MARGVRATAKRRRPHSVLRLEASAGWGGGDVIRLRPAEASPKWPEGGNSTFHSSLKVGSSASYDRTPDFSYGTQRQGNRRVERARLRRHDDDDNPIFAVDKEYCPRSTKVLRSRRRTIYCGSAFFVPETGVRNSCRPRVLADVRVMSSPNRGDDLRAPVDTVIDEWLPDASEIGSCGISPAHACWAGLSSGCPASGSPT